MAIRETYGLPEVAALIQLAAERYMTIHSAPNQGYDADRSPCSECGHSARAHAADSRACLAVTKSGKPRCGPHRYIPSERADNVVTGEYADMIHRRNLTDGERERILVGMADLDVAMKHVSEWARRQVADYAEQGPAEINRSEVVFHRSAHFRAICSVRDHMNGSAK